MAARWKQSEGEEERVWSGLPWPQQETVVYDREHDRELPLGPRERWREEEEVDEVEVEVEGDEEQPPVEGEGEDEDGQDGYHCQICGFHAEQLQPFNVHLHTAHPAVVLQELYGLLGLSGSPGPGLFGTPIPGLGVIIGPSPTQGPEASGGQQPAAAGLDLRGRPEPGLSGRPNIILAPGPESGLTNRPNISLTAERETSLTGRPNISLTAEPESGLSGRPYIISLTQEPEPSLTGSLKHSLTRGPDINLSEGPIPSLTEGLRPGLKGEPTPGLGLTRGPHPSLSSGPSPPLGLTAGPMEAGSGGEEGGERGMVQIDLTGEEETPGPLLPAAPDPLDPELDTGGPLVESFSRFPYPSPEELSRCGVSLGLPPERVGVWFAQQRLRHGISWTPEEVREARDKLGQAGRPESDIDTENEPAAPAPRGPRFRKTQGQLAVLKSSFVRGPYPDQAETRRLQARTGLGRAEIRRWFSDCRYQRRRSPAGGGRPIAVPDPRAPVPGRPRKSQQQLAVLKAFFLRCRWPSGQDYGRLVERTGLARPDIIQWFGDTRYALKNGQLKWVLRGPAGLPGDHRVGRGEGGELGGVQEGSLTL
ncbi:zinc fingers and homeoboxes protein 2-like [Amblyraja radiata]|uniref:zinc fingers and homeoboxes protein 2-like n=1 Tax=Amblyraja radiata TaxID=386614 RepID=UPI00140282B7|nr:zinc fingers and homeoboxes protein 2-like [Amblyraja radiata]